MVRVYPGDDRIQVRHFGWYDQPIGGHDQVIVRRKIGEPCDTLHPSNKALQLQRLRLTKAAKDWANLSRLQKHWWSKQIGWTPGAKLLAGQQLYTSKHMHGQLIHSDVDDPADPEPKTLLAPCVVTVADGGLLVDLNYLMLNERPPGTKGWQGERIGEGSYIFPDIPDKISDAWLGATIFNPLCTTDTHINSFSQLATIHYAVIFVQLILKLYTHFLHTFIAQVNFWTSGNGTSHGENSYAIAGGSWAGSFGASVGVAWQDINNRSYAWGEFYCPKDTNMEVCENVGAFYRVLGVYRDDEGEYHFY